MVTSSSSSSRTRSSGPVLRSLSPSGRFHTHSHMPSSKSSPSPFYSSSNSAFASSTGSSFSSPSTFFHRSSSPTRVNLYSAPLTSSVRISIDRSISPNRSISVSSHRTHVVSNNQKTAKKTCMCSPTTHPGSFRCSLHKGTGHHQQQHHTSSYHSHRLNMRRSAMTNSLVRIGGVEGDWVKRALTALIRPSSHQQRRRAAFEPKPSRLSIMSKADDL